MRPSHVICCIAVAACLAVGASRATGGSTSLRFAVGEAAPIQLSIQGVTPLQRTVLRRIVSTSGAQTIQTIRLGAPPAGTQGGRWIYAVVRRTDEASGTKGKWTAMLVGRAFADASRLLGLSNIRGMTIRTEGLTAEEGEELVLRLAPHRRSIGPMTSRVLTSVVGQARRLGIEVREVVALRPSRAVEVTGRLRDSAAYLRVLSETAGAPPVAVATYYQLADVNDRAVMRFGFVEGFAPADRLVAWVQPDLLRH